MDSIYKVFLLHSSHRSYLFHQVKKQLFELGVPEKKIETIEIDESFFSLGQYRYHQWHQKIVKKEIITNGNGTLLILTDNFKFHCTPSEFNSFVKQFDQTQSKYIETSLVYLGSYDNCIISLLSNEDFLKIDIPPIATSLKPFNINLGINYIPNKLVYHISPSCFEFYETILTSISDDFLTRGISFHAFNSGGFFFNIEPMSVDNRRKILVEFFQPYRKQLEDETLTKQWIDYSYQNMYIIRRETPWIFIRVLPIIFHPRYIFPKKVEKNIDISIVGTLTKRRFHIIELIRAKGIRVNIIKSVDMVERLVEILHSRILLLINEEENHRVFDFATASIPLFNFQTVVSENVDIENERGINQSILKDVHFTSYHSLLSMCEALLKNFKLKYVNKKKKIQEWDLLSKEDIKLFHAFIPT